MASKSFTPDELKEMYFNWLYTLSGLGINDVIKDYSKEEFGRLLHDIEFKKFDEHDDSRADDGMGYRYLFATTMRDAYFSQLDYEEFMANLQEALKGKNCSMLEMMVSLADKMENIMSDPKYPNRRYQWVNKMVVSMGLQGYTAKAIKENPNWKKEVKDACERVCTRTYEPSGKGGLFYVVSVVPDDVPDMRTISLYQQMLVYANKVTE